MQGPAYVAKCANFCSETEGLTLNRRLANANHLFWVHKIWVCETGECSAEEIVSKSLAQEQQRRRNYR